jgi:formyltetrahydrofolate deformylase
MRLEIEGEGFGLARDEFAGAFRPSPPPRHGLARQPHRHPEEDGDPRLPLRPLPDGPLWRWDAGELDAEIPLVVSNHPDLASRVEIYGIPFHHLPVTKETKAEQESEILASCRRAA